MWAASGASPVALGLDPDGGSVLWERDSACTHFSPAVVYVLQVMAAPRFRGHREG